MQKQVDKSEEFMLKNWVTETWLDEGLDPRAQFIDQILLLVVQ